MRSFRFLAFALFALVMLAIPRASFAQVFGVSITIAPPVLPVYEQPICPTDGYLWTPGYWAWNEGDYFWVPGTWVEPPQAGFLWTPGYWGWGNGVYLWNEGSWGEHVGFYGGVSYGFGYNGNGYEGGYWTGNRFYYNTTVNHVDGAVIHNTYNKTVVNVTVNRVSYNGGSGGLTVRPTAQQETFAHETRVAPTSSQTRQVQAAKADPTQKLSANHGTPPVAATAKPGAFKDSAVAPARGAPATRAAAPANASLGARPETTDAARTQPKAFTPPARANTTPADTKSAAPESRVNTAPVEKKSDTRPAEATAPRAEPTMRTQPESHAQPEREAAPKPAPQVHEAAPKEQPQTRESAPKAEPQTHETAPRTETEQKKSAPPENKPADKDDKDKKDEK